MNRYFVLFWMALALVVGCEAVPNGNNAEEIENEEAAFVVPETIPVLTKAQQELSDAVLGFGVDLFSRVIAANPGKDVLLSPASLSLALSLTGLGAEGQTSEQLSALLGFDGKSKDEVAAYYQAVVGRLLTVDRSVKFASANAVWADNGFPVKETFVDDAARYFNAPVSNIDFSNRELLISTINDWGKVNTNGMIPEILKSVPEKPMVLANALYYNAQWGVEFDKQVKTQPFHGANGDTDATFFGKQEMFVFRSLPDCKMVSVPYGKGEYDFVAILPDEGKSVADIVSYLGTDRGLKALSSFGRGEFGNGGCLVDLRLPRFEVHTRYEDLTDILSAMGATSPFGANADFSGISDIPLYIQMIIQEAIVKLDEKGTEASAITVIGMATSTDEPTEPYVEKFIADRPFLFLIREKGSGAVLFMGLKN